MKWTKEEEDILITKYIVTPVKDLVPLLRNRSVGTITDKAKSLGLSKKQSVKLEEKRFIELYNQEVFYKDIAKVFGVSEDVIKRYALKLQSESKIIKRGSNPKGRAWGGGGTLKKDKLTTVYLLYFLEEDFYKIGITQRSIRSRFSGYPEYLILDTINTTLEQARNIEVLNLNRLNYKPQHRKFHRENGGGSGGWTECFKSDDIIEKLCADC